MFQIWDVLKSFLITAGPILIFFFNLFLLYRLILITRNTKKAAKEVFSSPGLIIIWVVISIITIYLAIKYLLPLLP